MFSYRCRCRLVAMIVLSFVIQSEVRADSLKDPTRPLGHRAETKVAESLEVQAIFNRSGRKTAIINGQSLSVGDKIFGQKIHAIRENDVLLGEKGRVKTLTLRPKLFEK